MLPPKMSPSERLHSEPMFYKAAALPTERRRRFTEGQRKPFLRKAVGVGRDWRAPPCKLSGRCENLTWPMSEFAGSALINRPIEEVWRFISDPLRAPVWGRGVSDVVITSKGPVGLGTTVGLRMSGSRMEARMIRYEAVKSFTLEFTSGPVKGSKLTYSVQSVEGKTRLTTDLEMRLSGLWKLMYPVLRRRRIRDREWGVTNVKRILEAQSSTAV